LKLPERIPDPLIPIAEGYVPSWSAIFRTIFSVPFSKVFILNNLLSGDRG